LYLELPIVARDRASSLIYCVAYFWRTKAEADVGTPPFLLNDFLMQLYPDDIRIKMQGGRYVRLDGVRVYPDAVTEEDELIGFQMETVKKTQPMLQEEVLNNVLRYWARATQPGYVGDQRSYRELSEADPDGILAFVSPLRNTKLDYPGL
jgi:hypothetical protein